ncbi:hypothetical protein H0E84_19560 [Luteimonas sp. SJ-92]|uniref:Uncharacterized protein n=1 Tax=Luteimonas salinisoli TaxID=2752307 RepID=A0A853JI82_9GAMM|nr:DUF6289 family protein [Luteimonas salinisoli]NZA28575.1 hypothetical protein [Luteimonas salinisoli]
MTTRIRRTLLALAVTAAVLFVAGTALARYPILGQEWAEWTKYDSNGNAIGGGRIECDGYIATWGDAGPPRAMVIYPCH